MNLQFFAEGGDGSGESGVGDLADLLNQMDNGTGTEQTTDTTETTEQEGSQQEEQVQEQEPPKQNKQEYAFAQMRSQNSQLLGLVSKIAQAAGIEYKDNNELLAKLNDDAIGKIAAKQNVPVELLKRMEMLEQHSQAYQAEQLKSAALIGFQKLKTEHNLSDAELQEFAQKLDADGKNPFVMQMDLEAEYKLRYFDQIQEKKIKAAVEAALKKSSAADNHGSKPSNANGKPDTGKEEKISTVSGLNSLLSGMNN